MEGKKEGRKNLVSSCWASALRKETSRKISVICQRVASDVGLILRVCVWSLSHVQLFATPWTAARQAACPWDIPGKNTRVGCHFLLHGLILTHLQSLSFSVIPDRPTLRCTQRWHLGALTSQLRGCYGAPLVAQW